MIYPRVALIGLGLIASSMAHAMRAGGLVGEIVGYAKSPETRAVAKELFCDRVCDSAAEAVKDADLVVLAVPVGANVFRPSRPAAVRRPANLEEVAFWPVTHLAELVRTRQVTPGELTRMYLARLKQHGPVLEAVVTLTEERALEQARLTPTEVDTLNMHGTSTQLGDVAEARAVREVFGSHADRLVVMIEGGVAPADTIQASTSLMM